MPIRWPRWLLRAILCAKPDLTRLAVTLVGDVRHSGLARS